MIPAIVLAVALSADVATSVRAEGERRVRDAAEQIRSAVVAGDVDAIAARISPDGVVCGERREPHEAVQRQLRERTGTVYAQLFDTPRYREVLEAWGEPSASALSFRDFFAQSKDVLVDIAWEDGSGALRGWVTWGSPGAGDPAYWPAVQYTLDSKGNVWLRAFGTCASREPPPPPPSRPGAHAPPSRTSPVAR